MFNFVIVMYVPFFVFGVLLLCKCELYCYHRVSTQLQLNIYHIMSFRLHGTIRLLLDGFQRNSIFEYVTKICRENSGFIKIWQEKRVLYMKTNNIFLSYLAQFFLKWKMFRRKVVEKIKTHVSCSITFCFRKSCRLWDKVENYCRAGQSTDDMAHAHCMLDTLRVHSLTQNRSCLSLCHRNNGYTNAPHC